jgi:predicted DNA-binding WGR domain protein
MARGRHYSDDDDDDDYSEDEYQSSGTSGSLENTKPPGNKQVVVGKVRDFWHFQLKLNNKTFDLTLDDVNVTYTYALVGDQEVTVERTCASKMDANVLAQSLFELKQHNGYKVLVQKDSKVKKTAKQLAMEEADDDAMDEEEQEEADGDDSVFAYCELVDNKSSKFWEISVDGKNTTVRYGPIGAKGQTQHKTHSSAAAAATFADKTTETKLLAGYSLLRGSKKTKATAAAAAAASKKPAAKVTAKATTTTATKSAKSAKPLSGIAFAISGTLSVSRNEFRDLIVSNGGEFLSSVTKKVTYLITTEEELSNETIKVQSARKLNLPLVGEDFVLESIEAGKLKDVTDYTLE